MNEITDEYMKEMMTKTKYYSLVILKAGPNRYKPGVEQIIWEHGRRNFSLRYDGLLSIVCPVPDESELRGIGIFNSDSETVKKIMDDDPGVKTGVFIYEIHPCRSFPGDFLPK
jgi:hypothetical protein